MFLATALAFAVGCGGGVDRAPDPEEGGGGASGFGDDAQPTAAERTGATGDSRLGVTALGEEDRTFVEKATMANRMEVALADLAQERAQRDEVKQYAARIEQDHQAANRQLQQMLGQTDVTTAQQGPEHEQSQQLQQKLEGMSGAAFDRAYLEEMVKHHQQDIEEFERAAQSDNPQVREFAQRTLPTLREHLEQAQQLQQQTGGRGQPDRQ